ncbi:MAG: amidohydrolase [Lachnospiraceae bacterium]|nr:amidohydrolase [Lachnospiraceae bacterium]
MPKTRIDVHAHYLPPAYNDILKRREMRYLDGGFPKPDWNEDSQLAAMEQLGITYSALSISSPHLHMGDPAEAVEVARASNEYGAALVKKYPSKFAVMASLPLPEIRESVEEVIYCRDVLHVDGFSLLTNYGAFYLGDPMLDPIMEELNRGGCVVSLHPTEPSAVPKGVNENLPYPLMEFFFDTTRTVMNLILTGTLKKYSKIRFIVPHAGAYLPVLADRVSPMSKMLIPEGDIDIAESLGELYYDLGGVVMPKQYGNLRQIAPETHILYGSDTPFTPLPLCVKLSEDMDRGLDDEMADLVYNKNPVALFPGCQEEKSIASD